MFESILQMVDRPHIHVHYLDTNEQCAKNGYMDLEVCCHGCGVGLMLRVSFDIVMLSRLKNEPDVHVTEMKEEFAERHRMCGGRPSAPRGDTCSSYRKYLVYKEIR